MAAALVIGTDPVAGLRAVRAIELGAQSAVLGYIRACRETGVTWHEVGAAAGLSARDDTGASAAAPLHPAWARAVAWTCRPAASPSLITVPAAAREVKAMHPAAGSLPPPSAHG